MHSPTNRLTLTKLKRLRRPQSFQRVFSSADTRIKTNYWQLLGKDNQLDCPRLGLSIAKKKRKSAVDRNRFKRLIRECFRHKQYQLPHKDYIIMLTDQHRHQSLSNTLLSADLNTLFGRLH